MYGRHRIPQAAPAHDTFTMLGTALRQVFSVEVDDQFDGFLACLDTVSRQEHG